MFVRTCPKTKDILINISQYYNENNMHYKVLCDECDEVMVETHSDWIEDGETYEKTLKCPRCKRQVAVAIPFYKKTKFKIVRKYPNSLFF